MSDEMKCRRQFLIFVSHAVQPGQVCVDKLQDCVPGPSVSGIRKSLPTATFQGVSIALPIRPKNSRAMSVRCPARSESNATACWAAKVIP